MSREKQINEMARVMANGRFIEPDRNQILLFAGEAETLYNAGYRKQSVGEWEKFEGERSICSNCAKVFGLGSTATIYDVKKCGSIAPTAERECREGKMNNVNKYGGIENLTIENKTEVAK